MPRHRRFTEEEEAEIGLAIIEARPDPKLSKRNLPWKLLERRFDHSRSRLHYLWKEALSKLEAVEDVSKREED
jgi:hypothetical protein